MKGHVINALCIRIILRVRTYYMYGTTAKFKSANIFISAAGTKPPNLKIANISGYTVLGIDNLFEL